MSFNALKRSYSITPSLSPPATPSPNDSSPEPLGNQLPTPFSTPVKKIKKGDTPTDTKPDVSPTSSSGSGKKKKPSPGKCKDGATNGVWTPEKRGVFMDEIISCGYKHVNLDELASKVCLGEERLL